MILLTRPWRQVFACSSMADKILMPFFLFGVPLCACYELFIIFPIYYPNWRDNPFSFTNIRHIFCGLFFLYNSYSNMIYLMRTQAASNVFYSPSLLANQLPAAQLRECDRCNSTVPNRSHHCPLCDVCILRHDHHCWFAGCCVGATNYRFYLMMLLYSWFAGVYCNLFNLDFVLTVLDYKRGIIHLVLCLLVPHFLVLFGFLSGSEFVIAALTSIGFAFTITITILLVIQVRQLAHGQTAWDKRKGWRDFDSGSWLANWKNVLGQRWWLVWLSPSIVSAVSIERQLVPNLSKIK